MGNNATSHDKVIVFQPDDMIKNVFGFVQAWNIAHDERNAHVFTEIAGAIDRGTRLNPLKVTLRRMSSLS